MESLSIPVKEMPAQIEHTERPQRKVRPRLRTVREAEPLTENFEDNSFELQDDSVDEDTPGSEDSVVSFPSSADEDEDVIDNEPSPLLPRSETVFFEFTDEPTELEREETEFFESIEKSDTEFLDTEEGDEDDFQDRKLSSGRRTTSFRWLMGNSRMARMGARRPAQDMKLRVGGKQMYVPFLQRAAPATIDEIDNRYIILPMN